MNKTPHEIGLIVKEEITGIDKVIILPPAKNPIRLKSETKEVGIIKTEKGEIKITETKFSEAENLPEKKEGVIYIVSNLVCQAYKDRDDFYIVNETIRDEEGKIIGANSLARNPYYKE